MASLGFSLSSLTGLPPSRLAALAARAEQRLAGLERFRAGLDLPIASIRTAGEDWNTTVERAIDLQAPELTTNRKR